MAAPERFLCDGMLGSLSRWLRLLGFDASYTGSQLSDEEVLAMAVAEDRFLVTRDLALVQRAIKRGHPALLLRDGPLEDQLLITLMHGGVRLDPERFFTRCTKCGETLAEVPKAEVSAQLPDVVRERQDRFWRCPRCGQVYWEGSHVSEIEKRILDLVRRMAQPPA